MLLLRHVREKLTARKTASSAVVSLQYHHYKSYCLLLFLLLLATPALWGLRGAETKTERVRKHVDVTDVTAVTTQVLPTGEAIIDTAEVSSTALPKKSSALPCPSPFYPGPA